MTSIEANLCIAKHGTIALTNYFIEIFRFFSRFLFGRLQNKRNDDEDESHNDCGVCASNSFTSFLFYFIFIFSIY